MLPQRTQWTLGYRVRVDAHEDDAYRQDNLVDAAIASNAAAIILDNAGADASIAAVRRATRAGIAVFLIDREIDATGIAKAQIISDNDQGARLVAAEFARVMGGKGRLRGAAGKGIRHQRADSHQRLSCCARSSIRTLSLCCAQSANWSQEEAFQKTETMLEAHGEHRGHHCGERHDGAGRGGGGEIRGA